MRCLKSGLQCDGQKPITFVVGTIVKSRRSTKSNSRCPPDTNLCVSRIPRTALLSSSEFEIYICYALKNLRRGGCIELSTRSIQPTDLITPPVPAARHRIQISHQAIFSFAAIFFGMQHRQARITQTGFDLYGMVLRRLNETLSDPAHNTNDDLIYAVVTLSIMEMFVSTGAGNHLKHMDGLEHLLALRDHNLPISLETSELYRSLRQMILFAALRSRRTSILASSEWKRQLREHVDSTDELMRQEVFDILAECTVVIALRDHALEDSQISFEKSQFRLKLLKQNALSLLDQLHSWKKRWDDDKEHRATEIPLTCNNLGPSETSRSDGALLFTRTLEYPNDFVAITVLLYNIALIHVLHILALLTSPPPKCLPAENPSTSRLQTPSIKKENVLNDPPHFPKIWSQPPDTQTPIINQSSHTINPYLLAQDTPIQDICRSIPYHLVNSHRASSSTLHWAMATIWIRLRGEESVLGRWVVRVVRERNPFLIKTMKTLAQ
ncbi:hypothetical protein ONS96_012269 [Cadophora gregata f. sp. sojae]|nr:hypothetical protein ONS96_012269 [Cadophora gregata f. sp. sojae]